MINNFMANFSDKYFQILHYFSYNTKMTHKLRGEEEQVALYWPHPQDGDICQTRRSWCHALDSNREKGKTRELTRDS